MKILGVLITLALMQMSCLADGFYFCFKPACTKTYLKFNQAQMVSHLVKNHNCKKISANKIKMPDKTIVEIKMSFMNNPLDIQNGWFWYAENNNDMNCFIEAWRDTYHPAPHESNSKISYFNLRSPNQWDSLVQERRNELNKREGTLRDFTTGNNNTRLPNGSYGAGMRGFRRF